MLQHTSLSVSVGNLQPHRGQRSLGSLSCNKPVDRHADTGLRCQEWFSGIGVRLTQLHSILLKKKKKKKGKKWGGGGGLCRFKRNELRDVVCIVKFALLLIYFQHCSREFCSHVTENARKRHDIAQMFCALVTKQVPHTTQNTFLTQPASHSLQYNNFI